MVTKTEVHGEFEWKVTKTTTTMTVMVMKLLRTQ